PPGQRWALYRAALAPPLLACSFIAAISLLVSWKSDAADQLLRYSLTLLLVLLTNASMIIAQLLLKSGPTRLTRFVLLGQFTLPIYFGQSLLRLSPQLPRLLIYALLATV